MSLRIILSNRISYHNTYPKPNFKMILLNRHIMKKNTETRFANDLKRISSLQMELEAC